jgi:hypothetical protein
MALCLSQLKGSCACCCYCVSRNQLRKRATPCAECRKLMHWLLKHQHERVQSSFGAPCIAWQFNVSHARCCGCCCPADQRVQQMNVYSRSTCTADQRVQQSLCALCIRLAVYVYIREVLILHADATALQIKRVGGRAAKVAADYEARRADIAQWAADVRRLLTCLLCYL